MKSMETMVFGKWILAGEHAVLRGSPALVFPVFGKSLSLRYIDDGRELSADFTGSNGSEMQLLFWGVMERALMATGRSRGDARGKFTLESSIPVGAGLGASAALCVGVGRWIESQGWVGREELPEFCRELENLFHGESSGVDIAVAISARGLHFERSGRRLELEPRWSPRWYLSYSGKRGVTSECVARVKALWERDPALGERIDSDMRQAVQMAEEALLVNSESAGFPVLVSAIELARTCFERWGLASGEIGSHMESLVKAGAQAVKPTGSGDGGYVLSLWNEPPPPVLVPSLIALSRI